MNIELTSQGYLRRPNLHDGYVFGLNLVDKGLRVAVSDADGRNYILELAGLQRLRCNEFAEGNIIHHIIIATRARPSSASLRKLLGEPHPSVGEPRRGQHEDWCARCEQSVLKGDLTFVELQSSYGCEMWALCESVKIEAAPRSDSAQP